MFCVLFRGPTQPARPRPIRVCEDLHPSNHSCAVGGKIVSLTSNYFLSDGPNGERQSSEPLTTAKMRAMTCPAMRDDSHAGFTASDFQWPYGLRGRNSDRPYRSKSRNTIRQENVLGALRLTPDNRIKDTNSTEVASFLTHLAFLIFALRERRDFAPPLPGEAYSPLSIQTAFRSPCRNGCRLDSH